MWLNPEKSSITFEPVLDFYDVIVSGIRSPDWIVSIQGPCALPVGSLTLGFWSNVIADALTHARPRIHQQGHFRRRPARLAPASDPLLIRRGILTQRFRFRQIGNGMLPAIDGLTETLDFHHG